MAKARIKGFPAEEEGAMNDERIAEIVTAVLEEFCSELDDELGPVPMGVSETGSPERVARRAVAQEIRDIKRKIPDIVQRALEKCQEA